jgi:hypothetical protein
MPCAARVFQEYDIPCIFSHIIPGIRRHHFVQSPPLIKGSAVFEMNPKTLSKRQLCKVPLKRKGTYGRRATLFQNEIL